MGTKLGEGRPPRLTGTINLAGQVGEVRRVKCTVSTVVIQAPAVFSRTVRVCAQNQRITFFSPTSEISSFSRFRSHTVNKSTPNVPPLTFPSVCKSICLGVNSSVSVSVRGSGSGR